MDNYKHIPVLLEETIEGLNINPDGIYVDCTMGGAGHSSEILKKLSDKGKLYCCICYGWNIWYIIRKC